MRIALVSDTYTPQVNGVTTVVRRIAETLRATGHAVGIVAPAYPDPPPADAGGCGKACSTR
jgi:glycogen synthase